MRWSFFALAGLMSLSAAAPQALAAEDYAVLIISRERLEVPTNCEIGLYLNDQLAGRLFQEQATSFNLPAGNLSLRLKLLPGQARVACRACWRRLRRTSRSRSVMCASCALPRARTACTSSPPHWNTEGA